MKLPQKNTWSRFKQRLFMGRGIKRFLPRSLFGRTLLIVVTPTVLALVIATFVFFDRHWYTMTNRLAYAIAGDVATVVELLHDNNTPEGRKAVIDLAASKMDMEVQFEPGANIKDPGSHFAAPLRALLKRALDERLPYHFYVTMKKSPERIFIQIEVPDGAYTIIMPERRIYTPTTEVFIGWMIGSSILLSIIAILFMRNQIRPIRRLADAAEAIGKGRDVPWFKLEGALEVRQAGAALLVMHDRLRRQIAQRTIMLAGVSHDLRTPLTRMKLQLAMMKDGDAVTELSADILDMEEMLEAYLAFARGEEGEPSVPVDIAPFLSEIIATVKRQHPDSVVELSVPGRPEAIFKRNAIRRCIINLINNALRYGGKAQVSVNLRDHAADIVIDDDGPGIAPEKREEVFRPFTRIDESRNPATGGVGLGLTIARDIARFHGGDVLLEDSSLGGLRARIWLPM